MARQWYNCCNANSVISKNSGTILQWKMSHTASTCQGHTASTCQGHTTNTCYGHRASTCQGHIASTCQGNHRTIRSVHTRTNHREYSPHSWRWLYSLSNEHSALPSGETRTPGQKSSILEICWAVHSSCMWRRTDLLASLPTSVKDE